MSEYPSFKGKDPHGSPPVPNGSVWEKYNFIYLVQWVKADEWLLLNYVYEPYHTTGLGGSKFIPPLSSVSQEFLRMFVKDHNMRRLDLHFEPVLARREMRLLRSKLSQPCEVCFHNAWTPVEATDPEALQVLGPEGAAQTGQTNTWVRCDHCWLRKEYHALRQERDRLKEQLEDLQHDKM